MSEEKKPFSVGEQLDMMDITQPHLVAKILGKEDIARNSIIAADPLTWAALENVMYFYMTKDKKKELIKHLDAEEDLDITKADNYQSSLMMEFLLSYKNASISHGGTGRIQFVAGAISAIQENQQKLAHQRHLDTLIGI